MAAAAVRCACGVGTLLRMGKAHCAPPAAVETPGNSKVNNFGKQCTIPFGKRFLVPREHIMAPINHNNFSTAVQPINPRNPTTGHNRTSKTLNSLATVILTIATCLLRIKAFAHSEEPRASNRTNAKDASVAEDLTSWRAQECTTGISEGANPDQIT